MKKNLFCLVVLFCCLITVPAQAGLEPRLAKAIDNIYNKNFKTANQIIDEYISAYPENPEGYILRGIAADWDQALNNKKNLDGKIMTDYEKAYELAEKSFLSDPNNLYKKTLVGNSLMYMAKKHLDANKKLKAGNTLKKSKKIMEEVIAQDPNFTEAYFAIGLFNYFSENVPSGLKWLAHLLGFKGNMKLGLDYISKAAETPNLTQGDAMYLLYYIYRRKEKNFSLAYDYAVKNYNKYPQNTLFLFDLAESQLRTNRLEECRVNFEKFIDYCSQNKDHCDKEHDYLSYFYITWSYMKSDNHDMARKYFYRAKELDTKKTKERTEYLENWTKILGPESK